MQTLSHKEFNTLLYIVKQYTNHNLENKKEIAQKLFFDLKNKIDPKISNKKLLSSLQNGEYNKMFVDIFIMNTTYFFRNAYQFLDLQYRIIDLYNKGQKEFNILCLPCSSGEEAYSLALCLYFLNQRLHNKLTIKIQASDIDQTVLKYAKEGIYGTEIFGHFPDFLGIDISQSFVQLSSNRVQIKSNIADLVTFKKLDLFHLKKDDINKYDFIFSRNVWFYFDNQTIYDLQQNIYNHLKPKSYIYVGIGEKFIKFENIKRHGMGIFEMK